jgi:hypothetical protein
MGYVLELNRKFRFPASTAPPSASIKLHDKSSTSVNDIPYSYVDQGQKRRTARDLFAPAFPIPIFVVEGTFLKWAATVAAVPPTHYITFVLECPACVGYFSYPSFCCYEYSRTIIDRTICDILLARSVGLVQQFANAVSHCRTHASANLRR